MIIIVAGIYLFKITLNNLQVIGIKPLNTTNNQYSLAGILQGPDLKSRKKNNTCCFETDGKHFNSTASHFVNLAGILITKTSLSFLPCFQPYY